MKTLILILMLLAPAAHAGCIDPAQYGFAVEKKLAPGVYVLQSQFLNGRTVILDFEGHFDANGPINAGAMKITYPSKKKYKVVMDNGFEKELPLVTECTK